MSLMRFPRTGSLLVVGFALTGAVSAQEPEDQVPEDTVQWTASVTSATGLHGGGGALLELSGAIRAGWHVYALTEPDGGPTALRVTLDDNDVVLPAGVPSGTPPQKKHDHSFGLVTQFYTHAFKVSLPVQIKQQYPAGRQLIPVSVRFQTCSDRECQPPKTIHLSVPVEVAGGAS